MLACCTTIMERVNIYMHFFIQRYPIYSTRWCVQILLVPGNYEPLGTWFWSCSVNTGGGISKSISNYIENNKYCNIMAPNIDFMPPPIGTGGILFSGYPSFRPTVRPSEARNTLFPPVHWSVGPSGKPLPSCGLCVDPSIRRGFRHFPEKAWGNGLKFCMLM